MNNTITLRALDGSNPLAFLAALGTLRLAHLSEPAAEVKLHWTRMDGFWRPALISPAVDESSLCKMLMQSHWAPVKQFKEQIGANLTVSSQNFAGFVEQACEQSTFGDRRAADFAAAFGSEVCVDRRKDRIEYTDLCFITGSGHQDFIGTMDALAERVTKENLHDALFGGWQTAKGLSMRWDPADAAEYALQWDDPGSKGAWAVWGANRLATEALPFFPAIPIERGLQTTGFRTQERRDEFTWPIWVQPASSDAVRSLLALKELQQDAPCQSVLAAMDIAELFRAQRVRIGQGANFKVSFRQPRAV
jgi:hypothetical protein